MLSHGTFMANEGNGLLMSGVRLGLDHRYFIEKGFHNLISVLTY